MPQLKGVGPRARLRWRRRDQIRSGRASLGSDHDHWVAALGSSFYSKLQKPVHTASLCCLVPALGFQFSKSLEGRARQLCLLLLKFTCTECLFSRLHKAVICYFKIPNHH